MSHYRIFDSHHASRNIVLYNVIKNLLEILRNDTRNIIICIYRHLCARFENVDLGYSRGGT